VKVGDVTWIGIGELEVGEDFGFTVGLEGVTWAEADNFLGNWWGIG
jgi:hypothetical protein